MQNSNKQTKTIIILSIVLAIITAICLGQIIYNSIPKYPIEINCKSPTKNSYGTTYCEIQITCNKNTVINVADFTYNSDRYDNGTTIGIDKIIYNGIEYNKEQSFVIYPHDKNNMQVYINTVLINENNPKLYYKFKEINFNQVKKFYA